ncbi:hypothetical protein GCM10009424_18600 [Sphingomonas ursincola]
MLVNIRNSFFDQNGKLCAEHGGQAMFFGKSLRLRDRAMYRFGTIAVQIAAIRIEIARRHGAVYAMYAGKWGCLI